MRRALCLALLLPAVLLAGPALGKDVCVHTTVRGGWTFVLKKLSLKAGASGAVSGHAVTQNTFFSPISGGYLVGSERLILGITVYEGVQHHQMSVGLDDVTTFHHITVDLVDGVTNYDESWTREQNGTFTETIGDTSLVECGNLPAIP